MALNLNQTKFIQPIRSNEVYSSSTAAMKAINGLKEQLSGNTKADGVKIAAKYKLQSGDTFVETWLYGLYNQKANVFTFFDASVENINAIKGDIKDLQKAIGDGGSVEQQITNAISALTGTLVEGDATTLEDINDELDGIDTAIGSKADKSSVTSSTIWSAIEEVASEASDELKTKIESLDVEDTAVTGSYVSSVSETDGKISVQRAELPTVGEIKSEGQAIISVKQDKGIVSALTGDIAAAHVTVADGKFTAKNVEGVLSEIDTAYKAADTDLQKQIDAVKAAAKSYSVVKLTEDEVKALSDGANVKEAFKLIDEDNAQAGETIKVYKDSSLKTVALSGQTLNFTYILSDGSESTVGVDVSLFLAESEFGNGLQVVDHIVSIKLAEGNENFLTVDKNGVKLSGIQAAINAAQASATTKVFEGTDAGNNMTVTESTNADGSTTYTINLTDVASAQGLADEIDRATKAEQANADAIDAEATTARAAEKANADAIAAEKTRAEAKEAELAQDIADEQTRAEGKEAELAKDIADEQARAEGEEAKLAKAIADEKTRAEAKEEELAQAIKTLDGETVKSINVNGVEGKCIDNIASLTIDGGDVKLSTDYVAVDYPTTTTVTFTPVASESTIDAAIKQVDSSVSQLVVEVLKNEETVAAALTKIKESAGFDENVKLTYPDSVNYLKSAADLKSADVALDAEIKKLNEAIGEGGSVNTQITTAINALDSTVTGDGAHVDVTVTQVDGKITAVAVAENDIASAQGLADEITRATKAEESLAGRLDVIEGESEGSIKKAVADLKSELEGELGETDANTLAALNDRIDTAVANAKSYSVTKVTEGLEANVKEAYKLVDEDGTQAGELIPVYKDSALQSAVLGTATVNEKEQDCLILTYLDVNGDEQVVNIPLGDFLRESEFKAGLQVVNGEVSVKIAEGSESFLTVDVNGVKLSGIADAIDADVLVETNRAKAAEDKIEASIGLANDGSYVATTGNYTSEATTIASAIAALDTQAKVNADAIADEKTRAEGKEAELEQAIAAEQARAEAKEEELAQAIAAEQTRAEGKEAKLAQAIDAEITNRENAIKGLNAEVESTDGTYVKVKVTEAEGKITAVNVTEDFSNIDCGTF